MKNFVQIPVELLKRHDISANAKILYALMLDRSNLSKKNGWTDQQGIYIYYTIDEVQKTLDVSRSTAQRIIKELISTGLIIRMPQGQNKPYKIYVQDIEVLNLTSQNVEVSKMTPPEVSKMTPPEVSKMTPESYLSNHINDSYSSISNENEKTEDVKQKIEYHTLKSKYPQDNRTLNLIIKLICTHATKYKEINSQMIDTVMQNLKTANLRNVKNFRAYLQACLDNAYAMPTSTIIQSYAPTYDIAEYESHSITDFLDKSDWICQ